MTEKSSGTYPFEPLELIGWTTDDGRTLYISAGADYPKQVVNGCGGGFSEVQEHRDHFYCDESVGFPGTIKRVAYAPDIVDFACSFGPLPAVTGVRSDDSWIGTNAVNGGGTLIDAVP